MRKLTTKEFIKEAVLVHGDEYDYSLVNYVDMRTPVTIVCSIHGEFQQKPENHIRAKSKCPLCAKIKRPQQCLRTTEEFINESNEVHNFKYDYSKTVYVHGRQKVDVLCPLHGTFKTLPNDHIHSKSGCPRCQTSKGEQLIVKILESKGIQYTIQKRFSDCRYKLPLPFDFYLPDFNTCIEFDGIYHYKNFRDEDTLTITKMRDSIKDNYCSGNNISLIRIPYYTKKSEIESLLDSFI